MNKISPTPSPPPKNYIFLKKIKGVRLATLNISRSVLGTVNYEIVIELFWLIKP